MKIYIGTDHAGFELTESLPAEQKGEEFLDLPRLVMDFNRHDYGKLYEMLRFLNTLAE